MTAKKLFLVLALSGGVSAKPNGGGGYADDAPPFVPGYDQHEDMTLPLPKDDDGNAVCDWATLPDRVDSLKATCCEGDSCYDTCTIECAAVLYPLLDTCRPLLDVLLDMDDGVRDGVDRSLDTLQSACLDIPEADILRLPPWRRMAPAQRRC